MRQHTCIVCGAEFQSLHSDRRYCSGRCRTALYRANKRAAASERAPARAQLVDKLAVFAPATAGMARELISTAGDDCTELIVKLIAQAVREVGPQVIAGAPALAAVSVDRRRAGAGQRAK